MPGLLDYQLMMHKKLRRIAPMFLATAVMATSSVGITRVAGNNSLPFSRSSSFSLSRGSRGSEWMEHTDPLSDHPTDVSVSVRSPHSFMASLGNDDSDNNLYHNPGMNDHTLSPLSDSAIDMPRPVLRNKAYHPLWGLQLEKIRETVHQLCISLTIPYSITMVERLNALLLPYAGSVHHLRMIFRNIGNTVISDRFGFSHRFTKNLHLDERIYSFIKYMMSGEPHDYGWRLHNFLLSMQNRRLGGTYNERLNAFIHHFSYMNVKNDGLKYYGEGRKVGWRPSAPKVPLEFVSPRPIVCKRGAVCGNHVNFKGIINNVFARKYNVLYNQNHRIKGFYSTVPGSYPYSIGHE